MRTLIFARFGGVGGSLVRGGSILRRRVPRDGCLCISVYVCMCVCMYACKEVGAYFVAEGPEMVVNAYLCMYVCMYVFMHVCMYLCMYVCIYACMYLLQGGVPRDCC
jgi:hypothetical protein